MYTLIIEVQDSTKLEIWETQISMDQKNEKGIQLSSQSLSSKSRASNNSSNETIQYGAFSDWWHCLNSSDFNSMKEFLKFLR
jgi:hypothetical protein